MKIAYFSPFNPQQSGISDFSEELILRLADFMDIDIFYDVKPSSPVLQRFKMLKNKEIYNDETRAQYDFKIYHIGNNLNHHENIVRTFNDFPDILEFHDISIHNMAAGLTFAKGKNDDYLQFVSYSHGEYGLKIADDFLHNNGPTPWEKYAMELPCNKHLLDKARAVIVHSDLAKQMVKGIHARLPVKTIAHHTHDIVDDYDAYKKRCRKKLGIADKTLLFASFGFATPTKLIDSIIQSLARYKEKNADFMYYIVGEVYGLDLGALLTQCDLKDNVVATGFVSLDEFKTYMGACDIAFNLRYPTCGETSGSLHRLLGFGKPALVSDIGAFSEYPDNVVFKVAHDDGEIENIYKIICTLTENKELCHVYSKNAFDYAARYCSLEKNGWNYFNFLNSLKEHTYREENPLDALLDGVDDIDLFNDSLVHAVLDKIL
jgi:glycosyltransferase involved in cell wall biosynthesis